jgi:ferric-dicitrate binding protein FerR (iron transport regulator)
MTERDDKPAAESLPLRDPLAELIRAAGGRPSPPAEDCASVRAASYSAWQTKVRARKRRRWLAMAASLAVALGATAVYEFWLATEGAALAAPLVVIGDVARFSTKTGVWQAMSADTPIYRGDRLRTGPSGRAALSSAGGQSLRVAADTELLFAGANSLRLATGTIYIDSGDGGVANAIEIATPLGTVRDIGTQFEVHSTAQGMRVRVRSGLVEIVESPLTENFSSGAGRELELSTAGVLQMGQIAPDDDQWAWAVELAVASERRNVSILRYLRWAAREMGKALVFDTPAIELRAELVRFNAEASGLPPLEILTLIEATSDFTYELTSDGAILIRRRVDTEN